MKVKVVVVVFNRIENIKRWIQLWKQSETEDAELVIIHNYQDYKAIQPMQSLVVSNQITYIPRPNVGYDIGAFQDVCKERLEGFDNDWDMMLWCTDDCIPVRPTFVREMTWGLCDLNISDTEGQIVEQKAEIDVTCIEISTEYANHIRTTGFTIKKDLSLKLEFPADPIRTKEHCYFFEHRGKLKSFLQQTVTLGYITAQVNPNVTDAPLWDTGNRGHFNRWQELEQNFPEQKKEEPKITFICPIYQCYPQIISSLICQTHQNWHLLLIHDGPNTTGLKEIVEFHNDPRIEYIETKERQGNWGHNIRRSALIAIRDGDLSPDADYIVVSNGDNYHVPNFCSAMLKGFENKPNAVATFCSGMIHSYQAWGYMDCKLQLGWIDCAGVMIKKDVACEIGWRDIQGHSSDWTYFDDVAKKYGKENFIKVAGCLLVHN